MALPYNPTPKDFANDTTPSLSGESKDGRGHEDIHHDEHTAERSASTATRKASVAALLRNPLTGMSEEEVIGDVDQFVQDRGLDEYRDAFRKGALLARVNQRADGFEYVSSIPNNEKEILRQEISHRWNQPFMLYFLVILCAGSAIVQGMDQTAVNGAQVTRSTLAVGRLRLMIGRSSTLRSSASRTNGCRVFSMALRTFALL